MTGDVREFPIQVSVKKLTCHCSAAYDGSVEFIRHDHDGYTFIHSCWGCHEYFYEKAQYPRLVYKSGDTVLFEQPF